MGIGTDDPAAPNTNQWLWQGGGLSGDERWGTVWSAGTFAGTLCVRCAMPSGNLLAGRVKVRSAGSMCNAVPIGCFVDQLFSIARD
jgi:hypothetical protein